MIICKAHLETGRREKRRRKNRVVQFFIPSQPPPPIPRRTETSNFTENSACKQVRAAAAAAAAYVSERVELRWRGVKNASHFFSNSLCPSLLQAQNWPVCFMFSLSLSFSLSLQAGVRTHMHTRTHARTCSHIYFQVCLLSFFARSQKVVNFWWC